MSKKYQQNKEGLEKLKNESILLPILLDLPNTPITKETLMNYGDMNERKVRAELERIANFYPIRATAGKKGYSLLSIDDSSTYEEIKAVNSEAFYQVCELENRINSLKARLKPLIALMRVTAIKLQEQEQGENIDE